MKALKIVVVALVSICLGLCIILAVGSLASISGDKTVETLLPTTATSAPKTTKSVPATKAVPTIEADTLVHVGEDVPVGIYRVIDNVEGNCYWMKSSDSEGQNILANDIVQGGKPQVTLKKGQWFTSSHCGIWRKK